MTQDRQLIIEQLKEPKFDIRTGQDKTENNISAMKTKISTSQKEIKHDQIKT